MSQDATNTSHLMQLSADMDKALGKARASAILLIILSIVSVGALWYYLSYAHDRFTETLNPETVQQLAVGKVKDSLPQLKQKAIDFAPQAFQLAEDRLKKIPDEFATTLMTRTSEELDKLTPQVEQELYLSLKTALDDAVKSRGPGVSDEAQIKSMIDGLGEAYEAESLKLVTEIRDRYTVNGADVLAYLDFLATNKGLDKKQSLQRQALVTFLTIASRAKSGGM